MPNFATFRAKMKVPDLLQSWLNLLLSAYPFAMTSGTLWKQPEDVTRVIHRMIPIAHPVVVDKRVNVPRYYPVYNRVHIPYPIEVPYWIPVKKHVPKPLRIAKIIPLPKLRIVKKPVVFPVPTPYLSHQSVPIYKPVLHKRTLYVPKLVKVPQYYPVHVYKVIHLPKPFHIPVAVPIFNAMFIKRVIHVPYPVYIKRKLQYCFDGAAGNCYGSGREHRGYTYFFGHSKHQPQCVAKVVKAALVDKNQYRQLGYAYQNTPSRSRNPMYSFKPWHMFGKPTISTHVCSDDQAYSTQLTVKHKNLLVDDLDLNENRPLIHHHVTEEAHIPLLSSRPASSTMAQPFPLQLLLPVLTLSQLPRAAPALPVLANSTKAVRRPKLSHHRHSHYAAHIIPHSSPNATGTVLKAAPMSGQSNPGHFSQSIQSSPSQTKQFIRPSQVIFPQNVHTFRTRASVTKTMANRHTWPNNFFAFYRTLNANGFNYQSYAVGTPIQNKRTIWKSIWSRLKSFG